jgi:hypothetical protein
MWYDILAIGWLFNLKEDYFVGNVKLKILQNFILPMASGPYACHFWLKQK